MSNPLFLALLSCTVLFSCTSPQQDNTDRIPRDSTAHYGKLADSSFIIDLRVLNSRWSYSDISKTEMAVESLVLAVEGKSRIKSGDTVTFYQTEPQFDTLFSRNCAARRSPGNEFRFLVSRLRRESDLIPVDSILRCYTGSWRTAVHDSLKIQYLPHEDYIIARKYAPIPRH